GVATGSFTGTATALIDLTDYNLQAGSSVTSPGTVRIFGVTTIGGEYAVSGNTVAGGTADFTGSVAPDMTDLRVENGSANFHNAAIHTKTLEVGSYGTLRTDAAVSVEQSFNWNSTDSVLAGSGSLNLLAGSVNRLDLASRALLDGLTLNNAGDFVAVD